MTSSMDDRTSAIALVRRRGARSGPPTACYRRPSVGRCVSFQFDLALGSGEMAEGL